jgi:uncharacterized damage-inducible protein DinB
MNGAEFHSVDLTGAVLSDVDLVDVEIHGEVMNLTINDVDVGSLIEAELNKRDPERAKLRPVDPAGFRVAWDMIERLWGETVDRARRQPPELLHESVNGEWSFTETLRHLVFATDAWIRRAILGDPAPWDALGLPWDGMADTPEVPRDREATVRQVIEGLTDESLAAHTDPVEGPGWPPPRSFVVRQCLLVILNEEWHHRLYAERDLDILLADGGR